MSLLRAALFFFGIPLTFGFMVGVGAAATYYTFRAFTDYKDGTKGMKKYSASAFQTRDNL